MVLSYFQDGFGGFLYDKYLGLQCDFAEMRFQFSKFATKGLVYGAGFFGAMGGFVKHVVEIDSRYGELYKGDIKLRQSIQLDNLSGSLDDILVGVFVGLAGFALGHQFYKANLERKERIESEFEQQAKAMMWASLKWKK